MECTCGSQVGEYKSGISKKNNKPWRGWKCAQCGNMQFLRSQNGQTQQPAPTQQAQPQGSPVVEELKRTNQLLAKILGALSKPAINIENEELTPDETVPF